jgi:hypothetical protein
MKTINWPQLENPFLEGTNDISFRDPCAIYHEGKLWLYYSYVRREENNRFYWYTALSQTEDLINWTEPKILTERGLDLNYSSPGNIIRHEGRWLLCLQTLPTPEKYRVDPERARPSPEDTSHCTGDNNSRIWTLSSDNLMDWSDPKLLKVKGPDVSRENMGRMIDVYLCKDKDETDKWWCFYKQKGMDMASSHDLENWTYERRVDMGENVCVLQQNDEYIVYHSPKNGIGVKRSPDLVNWSDEGVLTLGQADWPWAAKRLTAGFVIDLREVPEIGKYLMFFHGSSNKWIKEINAHGFSSLGMAWSDDLVNWNWPS